MPAKSDNSHSLLADKLGDCIRYIKSAGFRSFPDFMRQLFVEFPKGHGSPTDSSHQTVAQTLRSFFEWGSLNAVLTGIATNEMLGEDDDRSGMIPDYCISPDITIPPGDGFVLRIRTPDLT